MVLTVVFTGFNHHVAKSPQPCIPVAVFYAMVLTPKNIFQPEVVFLNLQTSKYRFFLKKYKCIKTHRYALKVVKLAQKKDLGEPDRHTK